MLRFANARHLAVLRLIREGAATRLEISRSTGLSVSQVSRLTGDLIERGWVTVERRQASAEGRPAEVLALAGGTFHVVGLDVGGLAQQAVVANLRGDVVASVATQEPLSTGRAAILDHLTALVEAALRSAGLAPGQVIGLGAGLRAVVDPVRGVITGGPETPAWSDAWIGFPIREELARRFPWERIAVDDTVRALAVAEGRYGQGRRERDFVYVLADTGIGAAIMIGSRPYIGPGRSAGELGHVTLDPDGEPCACGKRGCLETVASTSALLRLARVATGEAGLTIEELVRRAEDGDPGSDALLRAGGGALGRGIATMVNLLAPRLVVIGGAGTTSAAYVEAATAVARAETMPHVARAVAFRCSALGPLAGATGAATMILDGLFEQGERTGVRRGGRAPAPAGGGDHGGTGNGNGFEAAGAGVRGAS